MKKALFLFLTLIFNSLIFGQELPTVLPPTPTAASFGKFLEVPVSLSTGTANINIPIWEIKEDDVSIPINLSYNSSGIKVEEIASWVGAGWNLNYGGGIFRAARGLPDDANGGYLTTTGDMMVDQFYTVSQAKRNELANLVIDNQLDYQPDIFNFSILGYSGKFFFDQNTKEIQFFSKDDIKIEPIYEFPAEYKNIKEWKVVLPNGVQCYFGEGNAYDISFGFTFSTSKTAVNSGGRSAWYISRIETMYGTTITYTYDQFQTDVCNLSSQGESYTPDQVAAPCVLGLPQGKYSVYYSGASTNARIQEIQSPDTKIVFNTQATFREDYEQGKALQNIAIYENIHNNLVTVFNFGYYYTFNSSGAIEYPSPCINPSNPDVVKKRLFLSTVQQVKDNEALPPHKLTYNTTVLPARTSYAQDYWGYYNGQSSNTTLVPEVYIPDYWGNGGTLHQPGADRKVNETYAKAGILEKIEYPIGGSSEFKYESNEATNTLIDFTDFLPSNTVEVELAKIDNDDFELGVFGTYFIEKTFTVAENSCSDPSVNNKIFIQSSYPCDNGNRDSCQIIIYLDDQEVADDGTKQCIELTPGQHELRIETIVPNLTSQEPNFYARVTREYIDDTVAPTVTVGGLRIQEIKQNTGVSNPLIKQYEYVNGSILNMPVYGSLRDGFYVCSVAGDVDSYTSVKIYEKRSNSATPLLTSNGSYVMYREVHEYAIDANGTKNGVTENTFSYVGDGVNRAYPFPPPLSLEWKRGNLLKQKQYKISGTNQKDLVRETTYNFNYKDAITQTGIFIAPSYLSNIATNNYLIKDFNTLGEAKILASQEAKEKFHLDSLLVTTNYFYDSSDHLQRTRTETINSRGDTLRTKLFYPDDVGNINDLGYDALTVGEYTTIQKMQKDSLHHITTLVQVETYEDNILTSLQRTNFRDWGANIILPEIVQTSKNGSSLEDRIVYHDYDDRGNPIEVSKADGTHIYYIWGYTKEYPIAKIENFTSAEALAVQALIDAVVNASNADVDAATEAALRTAFTNLRDDPALAKAYMTAYTYDPLIGVTSITDPRGYTTYYEYDEFNRLQQVKDADDHIVSKNTYHYKNQQ